MTKVAEDLGVSDVALKKICDKHRVPTPPRGYWAKRDAGKPTKQIQLHNTADPQQERIVIHGSRNNLAPEVREVLNQERERRKSKPKATPPAEPAPTLASQVVHVAATAKGLRKAKPDADDVVRANGQGQGGIEIGARSIERTIVILNAIAHALDARGLRLEPLGNCMRVALPPDSPSPWLRGSKNGSTSQPLRSFRGRSGSGRRRSATFGLESGRSVGNAHIQNLISSALANSASESKISTLGAYVAPGVMGSAGN
jgi:hypothetical protein